MGAAGETVGDESWDCCGESIDSQLEKAFG